MSKLFDYTQIKWNRIEDEGKCYQRTFSSWAQRMAKNRRNLNWNWD